MLKCGYCGDLIKGSCGSLTAHRCFSTFDEDTDVIKVDENHIVTMGKFLP